jgi:hypothetical protein
MQFVNELELCRRVLRAWVCTKCYRRPHGAEYRSSLVERPCEATCPLFVHLADLKAIARLTAKRDVPGQPDQIVKKVVCRLCTGSSAEADVCPHRLTFECPLVCYADKALEALETVAAAIARR